MLVITLLVMQRGRNKTVTDFPILIPTTSREAEGFAAFQGEKDIRPVRTLRMGDLKAKAMEPHEAKRFAAVVMLSGAVGKNPDALAIRNAEELLSEARSMKIRADESAGLSFPPFPAHEDPTQERMSFARALTELLSVPSATPLKTLLKGKAGRDPRWLLSYEISEALSGAKLVLWWNGESFKPAIWCPELKVAFYARAIMGTLRICPHCSESFSPERPDQDYCSVAHREAHRVARWRARQKNLKGSGKKQQMKRGSKQ